MKFVCHICSQHPLHLVLLTVGCNSVRSVQGATGPFDTLLACNQYVRPYVRGLMG